MNKKVSFLELELKMQKLEFDVSLVIQDINAERRYWASAIDRNFDISESDRNELFACTKETYNRSVEILINQLQESKFK